LTRASISHSAIQQERAIAIHALQFSRKAKYLQIGSALENQHLEFDFWQDLNQNASNPSISEKENKEQQMINSSPKTHRLQKWNSSSL
jgi:hypothetical protein